MNVYLDIDGVLLIKSQTPANHVRDFLERALSGHDVYWLTTRCKGNSLATFQSIARYFGSEIHPLLQKVKPTSWETLKTEAIDLKSDFLWFDDCVLQAEIEVLRKAHKENCLVKVDLKIDPDTLAKCISTL